MIDTIKGYIDFTNGKEKDFRNILDSGKVSFLEKGYLASVNISNFKITVRFAEDIPVKLYFNGSLPKFYYGNNLAQLDWNETSLAIQMLSDNLNVDFRKARLTRVDFGINLVMNYKIHEYLNCLLSFPRLDRHRYPSTVKFTKKHSFKSLQFYDKLNEIKANNNKSLLEIPTEYKSQNILRYELQLEKNLRKRLGLEELLLKDLLNNKVQNKIVDIWLLNYSKVGKLQVGLDPQHLLNNHNGLYKYLAYHGVEKMGSERLNDIIMNKDFRVKNLASKRSKLKATIKELTNEVRESTLDRDLIGELNSKIKSSKELIF